MQTTKKQFKIIKCATPEITSISVDTVLLEKVAEKLGGSKQANKCVQDLAAQPLPAGITRSRFVMHGLLNVL